MPLTSSIVIAALITLFPLLMAAVAGRSFAQWSQTRRLSLQLVLPALLCLPYLLVATASGNFRWSWFSVYLLLPVAVAALLWQAGRCDPIQRGDWRDFFVLASLGLAVDLRWFETAWPQHLGVFNKILLLDAGIWGFTAMRSLKGVGFDLRLHLRDVRVGLREFLLYTPVALLLGLSLGFLHVHAVVPRLSQVAGAFTFTSLFIATPEELFFRGWMQNLLERRFGRLPALLMTAALFGLSHFNKRALHFNWRYVLLAALAGIFYGRAWRQDRRIGASTLTHACVDTVWSIWLR